MILSITFISIVFLFVFGIFIYAFVLVQKRNLGMPKGELFYIDSQKYPGEILSAKSVALFGKPDYLVRQEGFVIPIEKKTSKTPDVPYRNHIAQLLTYCFLVQEHFGIRPPHGIIQYPDESFTVMYENETEKNIKKLVQEIISKKNNGRHQLDKAKLCRNCLHECINS